MRLRIFVSVVVTFVCVAIAPGRLALSGQMLSNDEQKVQDRRTRQNGIVVGDPKLFDDALLQQMLSAAQARLASLQLLDQAQIAGKVGGLSGADQRVNSIAVSVQTPSLPQVKTTEKGPTGQTVQKESESISAEGKPSSQSSTDVTTNQGTTDIETTRSTFAPPSPTAAQASTSLPTGFSVSASDLLNEQMQLTFEIANLRLLLDGAISDRMFSIRDGIHRVKPRRTIGVPIAIDPERRFKNAVAIVEVEIESTETLAKGVKPAIMALLPQEKTYNVAAIRESNASIGGGVVTQVVGIGGNWYQGRKTYYIVKDQDTLAQIFEPEDKEKRVGVAWQFRPVLGQEFVRPRQIHTFVQVSFPTTAVAPQGYATLSIRTYWRRYDRKHGTLKEMIPGSMSLAARTWPVPSFLPNIPIDGFNHTQLEDLGDGQMLVRVPTPLLSGTSLRIGSTIIREGPTGPLFSSAGLMFAASLSDLVTRRFRLIGRDGEETPLVIDRELPATKTAATPETLAKADAEAKKPGSQQDDERIRQPPLAPVEPTPVIKSATAAPIDESTSRLTVELAEESKLEPRQVLVIGDTVFGYGDAPIERKGTTLAAVVPTALLQEHPRVEVTAVLAPLRYRASAEITGTWLRGGERLVAFDETDTHQIFLLYGAGLKGAKISVPASATLTSFVLVGADKKETPLDEDTLARVTIPKGDLGREQIVLQRSGVRPVFVALPPATPPKKPAPAARERVVVGADQAVFDSDGLATLSGVSFDGKALRAKVATDNKSVTITGLADARATARAGAVTIDFEFGETKVTAKLEVISARVETVTPAK